MPCILHTSTFIPFYFSTSAPRREGRRDDLTFAATSATVSRTGDHGPHPSCSSSRRALREEASTRARDIADDIPVPPPPNLSASGVFKIYFLSTFHTVTFNHCIILLTSLLPFQGAMARADTNPDDYEYREEFVPDEIETADGRRASVADDSRFENDDEDGTNGEFLGLLFVFHCLLPTDIALKKKNNLNIPFGTNAVPSFTDKGTMWDRRP